MRPGDQLQSGHQPSVRVLSTFSVPSVPLWCSSNGCTRGYDDVRGLKMRKSLVSGS